MGIMYYLVELEAIEISSKNKDVVGTFGEGLFYDGVKMSTKQQNNSLYFISYRHFTIDRELFDISDLIIGSEFTINEDLERACFTLFYLIHNRAIIKSDLVVFLILQHFDGNLMWSMLPLG